MLGLFSPKTQHPLADAREAKRIFAEIAAGEPLAAVEDAGAWLESLAAEQGFKLAQRLELVFRLDDTALTQAHRLGRDYPAGGGASLALESRQWEGGHGYWRQLVAAYRDCIARYELADKKEGDGIQRQLPLLYGRLINALAAQLKWEQFRYGPVDAGFWMILGGVYLAAVEAKLAQKPLQLYAGLAPSTIEAEYLKVLVFQATSMDALQPLAIEIAEHLIAYFLPFFALIREIRRDSVYWVDAAKALPPTRLARRPQVTATLRFFNGARAVAAVAATIEQIRAEARVPPGINLGAHYEDATVLRVLEHLAQCWAPRPPTRSSARHHVSSQVKVVNGLAAAHQQLIAPPGDSLNVEAWVIDDVSLGGVGAQVAATRRDPIRIGALVSMQPEGGDNWLIGIVRRYVRTAETRGMVGIETISKTPRAVLADAGGLETEVLLLDLPEVGESLRMALPINALEAGVAMTFTLGGKQVRVHPQQTLETGADFVIANFLVQSCN